MAEQPQQPIGGPKPTHVITPNFGKITPRVIQASQLSPAERMLMEKQFGYDGSSPIPSDLGTKMVASGYDPAEIAREREALLQEAARAMPPNSIAKPTGLDPDKVPTQQLNMSDDELQQMYASRTPVAAPQPTVPPVTSQTFVAATQPPTANTPLPYKTVSQPQVTRQTQFEQLRASGVEAITTQKEVGELHPDIAQAFQMTQQVVETEAAQPLPSQSPTQPAAEPVATAAKQTSPDKPKTREDLLNDRKAFREESIRQLDPSDLTNFKQAVITGSLYTKTYTGWDGSLRLTFCDVAGEDEDQLMLQQVIDKYKRRYQQTDDNALAMDASFRMALAVCLRRVEVGGNLTLDIPASMSVSEWVSGLDRERLCPTDLHADDTNAYAWTAYLFRHILTGSLRQFAVSHFRKFQLHVNTLQFVSQDPESF